MTGRAPADPGPGAGTSLPHDLEERAAEVLLGPGGGANPRFEALCAANEPWRGALQRLRVDYERAARALPEAATGAQPTLPAAVGPYRILRALGEGAFGIVFLAEQSEPIRRQVAIKLMHGPACSQASIARFLNERETLARMSHPAVARIFDAGVEQHGRPWFAMEYVPGEPLHRFVAARRADLTARLELFLAACEGVNHAHQRGIIHRDLKPQNILVAEVDGRWLPKVIDFGLAKIVDDDAGPADGTRAGAVLGTPAYMSPEQLRGDARDADTRTDVYTLGVILYELLTGTLPVPAERLHALPLAELQRLVAANDPPLASARAQQEGLSWSRSLRGDLDWILRKAMAENEDDRYASVAEFAADVRRYLTHQPVLAGPPSTSYVLRKFVRRHRVPVIAGSLLLASLLLGLAVSSALYREASANARRAAENLADFWRLADTVEFEELTAGVQELWPSRPERLAEHEHWLHRANTLLTRRAQHADAVAALRARLQAGAPMSADEERGAHFLIDRLQKHLANLAGFAAADGPLAAMQRRTEFARTVHARSIADHAAAWDRAIAAVAASPVYGKLQLRPILGLVPLGPDPESHLEEFAHLQSGAVPTRDADGHLRIDDDTGIVLVLIPGGHVTIGSQSDDSAGPNYDPWRQMVETDLQSSTSAPFLIGKYELTQAQVRALGMPVQALGRMGTPQIDAPPYTPRHPEESVLGPATAAWLPHFELRLPTTYEWEIAARAGSPRIWGVGDRVADLQGYANVADATLHAAGPEVEGAEPALSDGFASHAPVGSLRPNAFGLYDVLGNVSELTETPTEVGTVLFLARGGSYMLPAKAARIGSVRLVMANQTTPELGVRVARDLP